MGRIEPSVPQLLVTDTIGHPFLTNGGWHVIFCDIINSGERLFLQAKSPNDDDLWVYAGIIFNAIGMQFVRFSPVIYYRFAGGTPGGQIWVTPTYNTGGLY